MKERWNLGSETGREALFSKDKVKKVTQLVNGRVTQS